MFATFVVVLFTNLIGMTPCSFTATSQCLQVLQLQSATTQPQSQPVDYTAGIEAMVLAILQQTDASLTAQQAQVVAMQIDFLNAQDSSASHAQLTKLYSAYLDEALAQNSNLSSIIQSRLLHLNSSSSLLPVRWM